MTRRARVDAPDSMPISPPPSTGAGDPELPAYVSNGVVGLRVRPVPLLSGMTLVNGFAGEHSERDIEAAAQAPYPLAGDLAIDNVWLSAATNHVRDLRQSYDFATGELTSEFTWAAAAWQARIEVLTFASREHPSLVCQELVVTVAAACDLQLRATVDATGIGGRALGHLRDSPGESGFSCDGALLWESPGGLGRVGCAFVTEATGGKAGDAHPSRPPLAGDRLTSTYAFRARRGAQYRLRTIASLVPDVMHSKPDQQAFRLAAKARRDGFDAIRAGNRQAWSELWKGRIVLVGADKRWQALADAAFFYINASTHPSAPASTSIFGLATWNDYHYYYGHVMWDIEAFVVPVLSFLQPKAADAILDYRFRTLNAARQNARIMGRTGAQFAWESSPSTGHEASPLPGTAAWHEDHVSLDVAHAFAQHAAITNDKEFLRTKAWPVLSGVAEWITSRVCVSEGRCSVRASMGIAERKKPVDSPAYLHMLAVVVLREAIHAGKTLGHAIDPRWAEIADSMALPMRGDVVLSHEGFRVDEEKGSTPDPLMGLWPVGYPLTHAQEQATLGFFLERAEDYIGSPMLSALYGVWAARTGDRELALKLMQEGYADFAFGRFTQILEYRRDRFPEQPAAGPFFANMGGFLAGLLTGFTRLNVGDGEPDQWPSHATQLPQGWDAIEIGRVFVRGSPMRLIARQGERAAFEPLIAGE